MISFCEQILLMLNVLMISYLLFNKEFNKHHCVKGIICLLASLVVIVLKKEISPSIINIAFIFLAYIFIYPWNLSKNLFLLILSWYFSKYVSIRSCHSMISITYHSSVHLCH